MPDITIKASRNQGGWGRISGMQQLLSPDKSSGASLPDGKQDSQDSQELDQTCEQQPGQVD